MEQRVRGGIERVGGGEEACGQGRSKEFLGYDINAHKLFFKINY
jgi:hypothetical protein